MQFKDIPGQERVKNQLRQSVATGSIAHAQLWTGPAGTYKLAMALAYVQYLNCPHRDAQDSCGDCPTCKQFGKMEHPDLHFAFPLIDPKAVCDDYYQEFKSMVLSNPNPELADWTNALSAGNKQPLIYDKESSEIIRKLSIKPFGEGYKAMIIWQVDKIAPIASNKLLKILEEPPARTIFILITEHPELLLPTITSRTQEVAFRQEQFEVADSSYLEPFKALFRNAWLVAHKRDYDALLDLYHWSLEMANTTSVGREKQKEFLQYAQRQVRENYIANLGEPILNHQTADEAVFTKKFAPFIHDGNVEAIMAELDKAERQIGQNGNAKIIFFDLCLQMIVLIKRPRTK